MELKDILQSLFMFVLTVTVPMLISYIHNVAKNYINKMATEAAGEEADLIKKYLNMANDAIETACDETTQTYVYALKNQNMFDEAAQAEAREKTIARAKELMTATTYTMLNSIISDVDAYITATFEAHLNWANN